MRSSSDSTLRSARRAMFRLRRSNCELCEVAARESGPCRGDCIWREDSLLAFPTAIQFGKGGDTIDTCHEWNWVSQECAQHAITQQWRCARTNSVYRSGQLAVPSAACQ